MQKNTMYAVAGVIVVILIGAGAYAAMHKSSTTTATTNPYTTNTTSTTTPKTNAATTSEIVQTKTASNVGSYLADANGNALYTYGADTSGVSNCNGSCTYAWPTYAPASTSATLPANVTIITRSDNTKQYAYKGLPLYTFTSDSSGKVTGDGVNSFHVAKP